MANTPQAKKRIRRNQTRAAINGARVSRIRTFVKKVEAAIEGGDKDAAAAALKQHFRNAGLPVMDTATHIVPLMVGDPVRAKRISDILLAEYGIYVQPINFPTVPRGTERLRFTPGPAHTDAMMAEVTTALVEIWQRLDLELRRAA